MNDVCLECDCPATIVTAWGDWLCAWHMDHGPSNSLTCPQCSQDATPAGLPVAAVDERPGDATDAGAPPPASVATISITSNQEPVRTGSHPFEVARRSGGSAAGGRDGTISPVVVLPPDSTTGELTLTDMVQAVEWCVTRAYDHDAPRGIIAAADAGLTILRHLERGYRQAVQS